MWIPKRDLIEMGYSEATIYRKLRAGEWQSQWGEAPGKKGLRRPQEILLESLPGELQMKWQRMIAERRHQVSTSEKRASAAVVDRPAPNSGRGQTSGGAGRQAFESAADDDASLTESNIAGIAGAGTQTAPSITGDDRIQRLAAALARFSPPRYSLEQRQAVENRCLELSAICDQVLTYKGAKSRGRKALTVKSPGASEAGKNRAYHPQLVLLAKQAASTDPTYIAMYPRSQNPPSVFTLIDTAKRYRKEGPAVFIRQSQTLRPDIDERFKGVPPRAVEWLRDNYESYSSGALSRFGEKWLDFCRRQKIEMPFTDWRPHAPRSCYAWLHNWRRRLPQLARTLAEEGQRSVEAKYGYIIRTYDMRPREITTMDWKQLDVCYWKPADKPGGSPRLVREWLCPALDVASRAPFGWHIQDRPNARGVTLAYLDGVSRSEWKQDPALAMLCGVQRISGQSSVVSGQEGERKPRIHLDNGKDFRSRTIKGDTIDIKGYEPETGLLLTLRSYDIGLAADFGVSIQYAKVRNAKAKIVEPWFGYAIGLWEEGVPGYCGNRPENKPHWFAAALRIHNAFAKREACKPADIRELPKVWREEFERNEAEYSLGVPGVGTPFLSEQEFRARFTAQLLKYLQSPHDSLRDAIGDMSPIAYLNAYADSPHMLTEQSTAILLMVSRTETVINGEIKMTWNGESFVYRAVISDVGTDGALYNLPHRAKVEVRYDPNAIGRVLVLNEGGPVCWAENPKLLGWNARADDLRAAGQQKKERDRVGREYWNQQTQAPPDWTREAEARQNVVQLKRAVGDEGRGLMIEEPPNVEAAPGAGLAGVTKLTRFDRGGFVGRSQKAEVAGFQGLTLVDEEPEDNEPWALGQMPEVDKAESGEGDDLLESILSSSASYLESLGGSREDR